MPITVDEKIRLSHLEAQIESGLNSIEAGIKQTWKALAEIRDNRLYRATHKTFESYCEERWDRGRRYINRIIEAGVIIERLDQSGATQLPSNEGQVRPLAGLPEHLQIPVWDAAVEISEGNPTCRHVGRAAEAAKSKPSKVKEFDEVVILDEDSPYYGQTVEVRSVKGLVAQCKTPDGIKPILLSEILPEENKTSKHEPARLDPIQALRHDLEVSEARVSFLEILIREAMDIIEQNLGTDDATKFLKRCRAILDDE